MKHWVQKRIAPVLCALLLCMGVLGVDASAASLVVMDLADVVDQTLPSVVEIFTETKQVSGRFREYVTEGAGSGVVLTEDGYIVTNRHVIDGAGSVQVRLNDGRTYPARTAGSDEKTDLAVLKIDAAGLTPAELADSSLTRAGDFVIAVGNPLGELGGTVTEGIISAKDRQVTIDNQSMTLLQTSAAVNPGNSGGGLFNLEGELVGVVNAKSSGESIEGLAFAIPANTVREISRELIQHGYVTGRPQLGISAARLTGAGGGSFFDRPGVYVISSNADSGLKAGDRIVEIDGTSIVDTADISAALNRHSVGDTVRVTVSRGGREIPVSVRLTEQKPA